MSDADHAAAVAEDYRHALEDLTSNVRVEIVTLTNVAKESINYAHAISEVLQNHIKKAPASRTLPGLYVLDSIVKNIGTPYTLYFGRNLFNIFMGAYTKVDNQTRRKMDEMLKTWKEPVPGSLDTRPVFPPDVVRPIENALIGARTAALAAQRDFAGQQQILGRGRVPVLSRDTPTPPNARPGSQQNGPYGQQPFPTPNGRQQYGDGGVPQQTYPIHPANAMVTPAPVAAPRVAIQPSPSVGPPIGTPRYAQSGLPEVYDSPQPGISVDRLRIDVQQLVDVERAKFAQFPLDTSLQARLRALLDLQALLQRPDLPQADLVLIKKNIDELSVNIRANNVHALLMPTYTTTPPAASLSLPQSLPLPLPLPLPPQPPTEPVALAAPPLQSSSSPQAPLSIDSLLGQGALSALMALAGKPATPATAATRAATTTSTPQSVPAVLARDMRSATPQRVLEPARPQSTSSGLGSDPMALIARLRQSGMLPASTSVPPAGSSLIPVTNPPPPFPLALPQNTLAGSVAPVKPAVTGPLSSWEEPGAGIQLNAASLKLYRPHLVSQLYADLGPQCTQCGRRFKTDEEGRRKKVVHMDWHFRVHQRIAEAEKRGQHRSWYVGASEWIEYREVLDTDYVAAETDNVAATSGLGTTGTAQTPKLRYIPAPDPSDTRTNRVCPICQEEFESKYMKESVDDWVWLDAVEVSGRVFHASCLAAAAKDGVSGGAGGLNGKNAVEPVLGKRKAEDEYSVMRNKIQMQGY